MLLQEFETTCYVMWHIVSISRMYLSLISQVEGVFKAVNSSGITNLWVFSILLSNLTDKLHVFGVICIYRIDMQAR